MKKFFAIIAFILAAIATQGQIASPYYGTYIGTGGVQSNSGNVVNPSTGDYCAAGVTNNSGFPTANAYQSTFGGGSSDAWVACMETTGSPTAFRFSTFLGGSSVDLATALIADSSGNLYVTGRTASSNWTCVGTGEACQAGSGRAFVAKFNSSGTIQWSALLGNGSGTFTYANAIALDGSGNLWISGYEAASNSAQKNGWVGELNSSGAFVQQSIVLTGNADTVATAIATTSTTEYIAGYTISTTGIATVGAQNTSCTTQCTETPLSGTCNNVACGIGFIATFNTSLVQQAGTYLGGTTSASTPCWPLNPTCTLNASLDMEVITALALDSSSPPHIYVTGTTSSSDFPTTGSAFQTTNKGTSGTSSTNHTAGCLGTYSGGINRSGSFPCSDAFISEFNTPLTTLVASTMVGSVGMDIGYAIKIDGSGNVWISGSSQSGSSYCSPAGYCSNSWPASSNALQKIGISGLQMFVTEFASNLQGNPIYSTLFGNGPDQWSYGLSFTAAGYPAFGGYSSTSGTACQTPTLTGTATCTSSNTYQSTLNGGTDDAFIVVVQTSSNQAATPSCTPTSGSFSGSVSVTCTDSSAGAVMCYTTNGTTPATNGSTGCTTGTLYSTAISITTTGTTLLVIAGGTSYTDSPLASNTYVIGTPALAGWMLAIIEEIKNDLRFA